MSLFVLFAAHAKVLLAEPKSILKVNAGKTPHLSQPSLPDEAWSNNSHHRPKTSPRKD
jgi:hypothetical protein